MAEEYLFLIAGGLLLASVFANKAALKFGVPALLLFLVIGMLAGSEGLGGLYFNNPTLTQLIGTIALTLILFSGGLDTDWPTMRPVLVPCLLLSTVGVLFTALLVGTFAWFMLGSFATFNLGFQGITWGQGLLLGAIVSSTDAAAVFSILRSSQVKLAGNLQPLLELESGSNDPMAVLLTMEVMQTLTTAQPSVLAAIAFLVQQLVVGVLVGYGAGRGMVWALNRLQLNTQGLYPVATLAFVLLLSGGTTVLGGNSFLAVYLAGIVLGNQPFTGRDAVLNFHDGLSWLMQIIMFLVLGLLVFPSQLLPIAGVALAIAACLSLVARPLSIFLCLAPFPFTRSEKLFLSWAGLRGSVPIILATFPLAANIPGANQLFNVVFFVVLVSVLVQGLSLIRVADTLKLVQVDE